MSAGSRTDVGAYHRDDNEATEKHLGDLAGQFSLMDHRTASEVRQTQGVQSFDTVFAVYDTGLGSRLWGRKRTLSRVWQPWLWCHLLRRPCVDSRCLAAYTMPAKPRGIGSTWHRHGPADSSTTRCTSQANTLRQLTSSALPP
jgi:hypothetical protein